MDICIKYLEVLDLVQIGLDCDMAESFLLLAGYPAAAFAMAFQSG